MFSSLPCSARYHAAAVAPARAPPRNRLVHIIAIRKDFRSQKNSLFYKTENGAEVGDLFMSLIYTCELNGVSPFDYLTELQKHATELAENPAAWMPWNYSQALGRAEATGDAG